MQKILWPTDLSKTSLAAGPKVMEAARAHDATVIVLYVAVDLCDYFPAYGAYPSQDHLREFQGWEMERARKHLEDICDEYRDACPNIEIRLAQGAAASQIMKTAEEEGVTAIVLATRGGGSESAAGVTPAVGSVASKVVSAASVPVITVNP